MDNAANAHIFNHKRMFGREMIPIESNVGVDSNWRTDHKPTAIGTARISWKDDDGITHCYDLRNALYFPNSPFYIASITSLVDQLNNDE
eukprot:8099025-Ditylum_brightwellii.AAC.1